MTGGPIARKLQFMALVLRSRAGEDGHCPDPLQPTDMSQIAAMLEVIADQVAVLEDRPIPARFRVITGGKRA